MLMSLSSLRLSFVLVAELTPSESSEDGEDAESDRGNLASTSPQFGHGIT